MRISDWSSDVCSSDLLEAHRIGWGASGRNGGQLIRGVGHDVEQFSKIIGEEGVDELKRMGFEAVDIVRQRIERYAIDCDLTWEIGRASGRERGCQDV